MQNVQRPTFNAQLVLNVERSELSVESFILSGAQNAGGRSEMGQPTV